MIYEEAFSLAEGIESALTGLYVKGRLTERENQDRLEKVLESSLVLIVKTPELEPGVSKAMPCGLDELAKYLEEFLDGTADDIGWEYTYHKLYAPYLPQVIEELKREKSSRRACIALGQNNINFSKNPPCLQLLYFQITEGYLELKCVFRSNDAVKAFPMNIEAIAALQREVAHMLQLKVGILTYIALNFHAYAKDISLLEQYIVNFRERSVESRTYKLGKLEEKLKERRGIRNEYVKS